jgi:hypothetical protein
VSNQGFFSIAFSRQVIARAIKVALIVGRLLDFINHGDKILAMTLTIKSTFQIFLTYLVPYAVSTWSAVRAIKSNTSKNK